MPRRAGADSLPLLTTGRARAVANRIRPFGRRTIISGALALALLAGGLTATVWLAVGGSHLRSEVTGGFGMSIPAGRYGRTYTVGDLVMCLDGAGPVTVDSVAPMGGRGIALDAWGVSRWSKGSQHPSFTIGDPSPLSHFPWLDRHDPIVDRCSADENNQSGFAELATQVRATSSGTASLRGFAVSYTDGRRHRRLLVRFGFTICPGTQACPDESD